MSECVCLYMCVSICVCIYICVYIYVCVYICVNICVFIYVRVCKFLQIFHPYHGGYLQQLSSPVVFCSLQRPRLLESLCLNDDRPDRDDKRASLEKKEREMMLKIIKNNSNVNDIFQISVF